MRDWSINAIVIIPYSNDALIALTVLCFIIEVGEPSRPPPLDDFLRLLVELAKAVLLEVSQRL